MHELKASALRNRDRYCIIRVHHIKTHSLAKCVADHVTCSQSCAFIKPVPNLFDLFLNLFFWWPLVFGAIHSVQSVVWERNGCVVS